MRYKFHHPVFFLEYKLLRKLLFLQMNRRKYLIPEKDVIRFGEVDQIVVIIKIWRQGRKHISDDR